MNTPITGKTNRVEKANIEAFLQGFLASLEGREREVVRARYGLDGADPMTLQAIGNRYHVTRERIRQIEAGALLKLEEHRGHPYVKLLAETAARRLKEVGGIEREDTFLPALRRATSDRNGEALFANAAMFLLELSGKISQYRDNYGAWHPYWHLSEADRKKAHSFVGQLTAALEAKRAEVLQGKKFDAVLASVAKGARVTDAVAKNYLALSRNFLVGPFGEVGLAAWAEVNPKTARDWAYAVLKREKKPLHFGDLAKTVANYREHKRTNPQTIHNELIKDDRFVLVGRGLYTLREFGYIPGTAREIIAHVLKEHGPLARGAVVNHVKEQRMLKDATILINLQNRKHFERLSDGRYDVREA